MKVLLVLKNVLRNLFQRNYSVRIIEKFKTVGQVAVDNGCGVRAVQKWCAANDVPFIGNGRRKQYMIYWEHEEAFKKREKPGRRFPRSDEQKG